MAGVNSSQLSRKHAKSLRCDSEAWARSKASRRRHVSFLGVQAYANSKHATEADKLAMKLQHKEGKLLGASQAAQHQLDCW